MRKVAMYQERQFPSRQSGTVIRRKKRAGQVTAQRKIIHKDAPFGMENTAHSSENGTKYVL